MLGDAERKEKREKDKRDTIKSWGKMVTNIIITYI
jgi:hypothetical protein